MKHDMPFPILEKLGLSQTEALIYGLLLESGTTKARDLVQKSDIGRGNVYNILMQLKAKGLVLMIEGKQQQFQAVDPSKLRSLLENQLNQAKRLEEEFQNTLPQLTSTFNLSTGKPVIEIFEGLEGSEKALADSLTSTGEILTYLDPDALAGPFAEINKRYIKQRIEKQIKKRIILPKTKTAETYAQIMKGPFTEIRLVENFAPGFSTAMELYNNKVAFHTLTPKKTISFIIEDSSVTALQRAQFECMWKIGDQPQSPHTS
ncbi:hypothetical protein EXS71_01315 [Candidatus Uhrbacteria bacterium]|nr:hypothetical protein [Candidatus Uhrbacteria bacterium]